MKRLRLRRRWKKPPRPPKPALRPADPAALANPYAPCYRPARSFGQLRKRT